MSGGEHSGGGGGGLSLAATTGAMVAAVIAVFLLFLVLFFLYLRSKRYWGAIPASSGAARAAVSDGAHAVASRRRGLDVAAVAALPAADPEEGGECAVCLGELAEGVRLLPGCGHAFHLECIDQWFRAHFTCPLCRSALAPAAKAAPRVADPGAARPDLGESSRSFGGVGPMAEEPAAASSGS